MSRVGKAFWIWCQFIKDDMDFLKDIQLQLFKDFKSPFFEIHLTLYGPYYSKKNLKKNKIYEICKTIKPTKIKAIDYKITKNIYTSIFIDILKSKNITLIKNNFKKVLPVSNKDFIFKPHISLIYGNFPRKEKLRYLNKLPSIKNKEFTIKNIAIADVDEKINKWKIIERVSL